MKGTGFTCICIYPKFKNGDYVCPFSLQLKKQILLFIGWKLTYCMNNGRGHFAGNAKGIETHKVMFL